ncbi:MAG: ABC transporter ATP-binding protein [Deltaproteobacteria bacterium]|nr:ABC transporter ATP-binding protein [Deltaproteobacteria bacterium]MBW2070220.1 ABC transporter ATP-binding protein [Deltaproteobacteria bacterium]
MTEVNNNSRVAIRVEALYKTLGGQPVLRGLDLHIERGKTTAVIGQSGSGKSVLLKHIIGLMKPDSGKVLVDGVDIAAVNSRQLNEIRKKFGMLFQGGALFDSMTVAENVAFPLREHTTKDEEEIAQIVADKLRQVGLKNVEHKMPSELSGGMKKRVALARAIALDPEIILFDEPTTGLDPVTADAINDLIITTHMRTQATLVVISHDIEGTFKVAHKVAMLYEGRIIMEGTPEHFRLSNDPVVRQFIEGRAEGPIVVV